MLYRVRDREFKETGELWLVYGKQRPLSLPWDVEEKDAGEAGTWFLSYLSEIGYIDTDDVYDGCVFGTVSKQFVGLELGSYVYIRVDGSNPALYHVCIRREKGDEWWEQPGIEKFDFLVDLGMRRV